MGHRFYAQRASDTTHWGYGPRFVKKLPSKLSKAKRAYPPLEAAAARGQAGCMAGVACKGLALPAPQGEVEPPRLPGDERRGWGLRVEGLLC